MALETTPDAPAIPGLTFRHFRGAEDYPLMIPVIEASRAADQIHEVETVERLAQGYANTKGFDPTRDVIMAEIDGRLAGYRSAMWWDQLDGVRILHHFGFLRPEWRGQGLERALVHTCEARLRQIAQEHPAERSEFDTYVADTETALDGLLQSEGYTATRHFYDMVRPDLANIPDAPLPPGLEVRPARPEDYRAIWEAETEAFQDHWGEEQVEEADFARWQHDPLFQPDLWQVAWDGDLVAGMVRGFIDPVYNARFGKRRGFTENISTRRPWRKRGLAAALIARSLRQQQALGMTESALGVDTENPSGALRLYEQMGFQAVKRFSIYRKPLE